MTHFKTGPRVHQKKGAKFCGIGHSEPFIIAYYFHKIRLDFKKPPLKLKSQKPNSEKRRINSTFSQYVQRIIFYWLVC